MKDMHLLNFCLVLFLSLPLVTSSPKPSLDIITSVGTFRGFENATEALEKWLGIPFAQPPVGDFRFKRPQAITKPFSGIVDATKFGSACPQPVSYKGEDEPWNWTLPTGFREYHWRVRWGRLSCAECNRFPWTILTVQLTYLCLNILGVPTFGNSIYGQITCPCVDLRECVILYLILLVLI